LLEAWLEIVPASDAAALGLPFSGVTPILCLPMRCASALSSTPQAPTRPIRTENRARFFGDKSDEVSGKITCDHEDDVIDDKPQGEFPSM
jgi:hypothetical protein